MMTRAPIRDPSRDPSHNKRGAVAVLVAVLIVVLLGFTALVVDIGHLYRTRNELQNAADSAALAGAQHLDRSMFGLERARAAIHEFAGYNEVLGTPVIIQDTDIQFGHWSEEDETFMPLAEDQSAVSAINSVRVIDRREQATGNPVPLYFSRIFGRSTGDVNAVAIAIAGGPLSECGFPMVVADCQLDEPISEGTCDYCMVYQDNNTDNAGWTTFGAGEIGGPAIADLVDAACFSDDGSVLVDPETGECMGTCVTSGVGDEIKVNNGNLMNSGAGNFCPLIQQILTRGVANGPAYPFTVRVPVLESAPGTCDGLQFSGSHPVAGYAALEIFGVKCGNADPGVIAPSSPCEPPPSGKFLVAALRCDLESGGVAGGGYYGVDAVHVRLVR